MPTKIRFPDLTTVQDPNVRAWANELVRTLREYADESKFIEIDAIVTAGTNITVSSDPYGEKLYINAGSTGDGGGTGSDGILDGGDRIILDGLLDGGVRI